MRSISVAALAVLSCATQSVADEQLRPKYYFPKDVKRQLPDLIGDLFGDGRTTVATSTSASSGGTDTLVVPVYVYVGADGKTSTTTGEPITKTPVGTIAKPTPSIVDAGPVTDTPNAKSPTKATATAGDTGKSASDDGGLFGGLGQGISKLLNPGVGSTAGLPATIVQPTKGTPTSHTTHTSQSTHSTSAPTSSDPPNFLSSLLGGLSPSSSSSVGAPTSTGVVPGITVGISSIITGSSSASPTSTGGASASASGTTSSPPLLSIPPWSSIFPGPPSSTKTSTKSSSVAVPTTTSSSHPSVGPTTSSSATVKPSGSGSVIPTTTTSSTPSRPANPSQTQVTTSGSASASGSSRPVTTKTTSQSASHVSEPTTTITNPSKPTTSTSQSTASDTPYIPPPVITPTAASTGSSGQETTAPTQIPSVILPPGGTPEAPENSTLVQFGFDRQLPWPTVASSMNWPDQIYYYTPIGVSYALAIVQDKVTPYWLGPYDTGKSLGYNTTLIKFFIPSDLVDTLNALRSTPASDLYQQPNTPNEEPTYDQSSIKNLFSMLNTDIPLVAQQPSDSSDPGSGDGSDGNSSGGNNDHNAGDGGASASSGVRASSVGIGVGVAAGAAAYAGAMFYVARRYRKRKQLHQRSSSIPSASMSEAGNTGFLSARNTRISHNSGRSNRTAMISAPVMSENSLGWN